MARIDRRVWFRPLLLLGSVFLFLPVILRRAPDGWREVLLVVLLVIAGASLAAHLAGRRLHGRARTYAGWALMGAVGIALLVVTVVVLPEQPQHVLPAVAGVAVAIAPARRARLRLPVQALLIAGIALLLLIAGRPPVEIGIAVGLLVFAVWLTGVLSQSLLDVRQRRLTAREAAERRAELLSAVGDLSARTSEEAARRAVDSLRDLGFTVAGVSVVQDGVLLPLALAGLPPAPDLRLGEGLAGTAIAEDRILVAEDYARDPRRLPDREELGAAVAVPVRVDGRAAGVVLGGRDEAGPLPASVVEVAEVLAGHLGGVLETERRLDRQRELLERMQALDVMRQRLVAEVSEEVRDPLTVVRGISETLVVHAERLDDEQRMRLLEGFVEQARALRATIDALLDFSRLHAARPLPSLTVCRLAEALGPGLEGVEVDGDLDPLVRTDPDLLSRALETVRTVGTIRRLEVGVESTSVRLRLTLADAPPAARSPLLLGLAERLVVTVGGGWWQEGEVIELRLPRGPEGGQDDRGVAT